MNLKLLPEDDFKSRNPKTGEETHINRKVKADSQAKNPWHGKYDRRKTPRDTDIVFSIPLAANDRNFGKPEND